MDEPGPQARTLPGSVRSIRKGQLRAALFGAPPPKERLGRYELRSLLGRGGMGTVVEAYDTTLGRTVALKLLHADMVEQHGKRLLREARALAKLSHPNVVQVHEAGELDGRAYIAMELVRGQLLRDWQAQPRAWRDCVEVYRQAGRGLAAAHAAGLVHRDFKPGNCMLDEQGRVRVLDFGLVRDIHGQDSSPSGPLPSSHADSLRLAQTLSKSGAILGTLLYMSPEQLCGRPVDAKSDQWSFCAALFEALYGQRPFPGTSIGELITNLMGPDPPQVPRGVKVPAALRSIVGRGLARDPQARWPSMDVLLGELARPTRPTRWIAVGAVLLTVAVAVPVATWIRDRSRSAGCRGEREAMDGAWTEDRRQRVHDALSSHGLPHGEHAWSQVDHRVGNHVERWQRQLAPTCAGLAEGADDSRRLGCLGEQRIALEEVLAVLESADVQTTTRALEVLRGLPDPERCAVDSAIHDSPDELDEGLVRRLARARALTDAGHDQRARAVLGPALETAEATGRSRLHAQGLWQWARLHPDQAETILRQAHAAAEAGRDPTTATRVASELVVRLAPRDPDEAERWRDSALAHVDQAGAHAQSRGAGAEAVLHAARGDPEAAELAWRRAIEQQEQLHRQGPVPADLPWAHAGLARVLAERGRLDDAVMHAMRALVLEEVLRGPEHPALVQTLEALASLERARGNAAAAQAFARRAEALGGDPQAR